MSTTIDHLRIEKAQAVENWIKAREEFDQAEYEIYMAGVNRNLSPEARQIYLEACEKYFDCTYREGVARDAFDAAATELMNAYSELAAHNLAPLVTNNRSKSIN